MNREEALATLNSRSAVSRLQAARALYAAARPSDVDAVERALATEHDAYVQRALARVCLRLRDELPATEPSQADRLLDSVLREEIRTQVVEEMSKVIAHEMESTVGFLNVHAREDIGEGYDTSRTRDDVQRLLDFLEVLERLNSAASPPVYQELDLGDVILQSVREAHVAQESLLFGTTEAVIVQADPKLLKLALTNVLLNAVEACESTGGRITINWGTTDRDSWVAVLDEGAGLQQGYDRSSKPGTTTKQGHFGWGLTIVRRALASMGSGEFSLLPRNGGGTAAELRWPNPTEAERDADSAG